MKNLITYDTIKLLKKGFISSLSGLSYRRKLWSLVNFQNSQLFVKYLKAQHHLIESSYDIQKAKADIICYKIDDEIIEGENLDKIIKTYISYELISAVQEYHSFKEFLQNLLLSLFLDEVSIINKKDEEECKKMTGTKISNEFDYILYNVKNTLKGGKINSEIELLKAVSSEVSKRFIFGQGKQKERREKIRDLKLKPLLESYNLWNDYCKICEFFCKPEVKKIFNANEIKHYFIPLGSNSVKFDTGEYLDLEKDISLSGGNFEEIDLDITKTQEFLIEFNNMFVDFVNSFFEKYEFTGGIRVASREEYYKSLSEMSKQWFN